jgi:hypothetical protein
MKKLLVPCAIALGALALGAGPAAAAPCTPTTLVRDGQPLTAQLVNPPLVTGDVDATGCDIGVYVDTAHTSVVTNADVHDARYFGIVTRGAGSSTTVSNSQVHEIGDTVFNGSQHGIGVAWIEGSSGSIRDSHVFDYQKGGVVVSGDGTTADTIGNDVNGRGATPLTAQNGVQYSFGARGEASYNSITGNNYTGCSNKDAAKTGCTPFVAAGLLLFDVAPGDVNRNRNLYRDDQKNELVSPSTPANPAS